MKKKKLLLIAGCALILSVGAVIAGIFFQNPDPAILTNPINIPGYTKLQLAEGIVNYDILLSNSRENRCTFRYTLLLEDSMEVLYTSPVLRPGQSIRDVTLNRSLPEGEYAGILRVDTASLSDGKPMNGSDMQLTLKVAPGQ